MERSWKRFWPPGLDERQIQLPREPLHVRFKQNAEAHPARTAIIFYGRELSFAELDDASDRFAGWLRSKGLEPGERVGIYLANSPQFAIAYLGSLKAGCVNVCLNPMNKAAELHRDLLDAGARVLVTADCAGDVVKAIDGSLPLEAIAATSYSDYLPASPTLPVPLSIHDQSGSRLGSAEDFLTIVREARPLKRPEPRALGETALLQYTSGTTGVPKGAEITHGNLVANCELQRVYIGLQGNDVTLGVLPWFHITGMECQLNMALFLGTPLVALGRFELETVLEAVQRYRCTATTLIATINVAITNYPRLKAYDLSSLRHCFSGGAPVPSAVAERWEAATGFKLMEGYGLSETTAPTHINPPHRPKYGTVGLALPLTDVSIVDVNDGVTELSPGEAGEILVKGPMVMKGYWRRPEATAESLRAGWLHTGDIGRLDEEGYLRIEERKKDLIKASGFSVYPAEVEAALYRHPAVAEVGVVGVPDPYRGEDVMAFVVLRAEARGQVTDEQIVGWCRDEMAVYKAPRQVRFVESLPRTASGKLLRRALRDLCG